MKSIAWRKLRGQILARDSGRCRLCGTGGKGLEVHHLTYVRLGCEHEDDLITLCHSCHAKQHATERTERNANACKTNVAI